MLPDRSKRYAGIDGEIPRLGLASNWHLFFVAVLVAALLALIFPRKALIARLYEQSSLDELTLSYIQNLYRAEKSNADVAILLAKSRQFDLDLPSLRAMVLSITVTGDERQRTESLTLLANAYARALAASSNVRTRGPLTAEFVQLMDAALQDDVPMQLARFLSEQAFELGVPRLGMAYLKKIEGDRTPDVLERYAQIAIGEGKFTAASSFFMLARHEVSDMDEARRLFQAGVGALMASSQFKQAMMAADQHLGNLANDPDTLRYLARTALAAGDTARAASYARRLVFERPNRGLTQ
jgi:polysaccharide biosynthesis protein PelB